MKQQHLVFADMATIRDRFAVRYPDVARLARESSSAARFGEKLMDWAAACHNEPFRQRVRRLVDYDATEVYELSSGMPLKLLTITSLWRFLRDELPPESSADFFVDLYYMIDADLAAATDNDRPPPALRNLVRRRMRRWPTGLDEDVIAIRADNKKRIIKQLIPKIERHPPANRYHFPAGMSAAEKYRQVKTWWNEHQFHLAMAAKTPGALNAMLGGTLLAETMRWLTLARKKGMPFFATPYYLSLLDIGFAGRSGAPERPGYDDATIREYVIYSRELIATYGSIRAWEREDTLEPGKPNAAGWLLPEGNNIHRRYPEVAILIPDSRGRACGGMCSSCQRMYDFQRKRLHFDLEALLPKEGWDRKLRRLLRYFEEDSQLRDILITGGDALLSRAVTLDRMLDAIYEMAKRKRRANEARPDGEKYAELQRVRLGSRLLVYLPQRVTADLLAALRKFRTNAARIGVTQFFIQTHFESPLEITPESLVAIRAIQKTGWTITNQLVFTVPASRRGHTARLRQVLSQAGIVCYYTFTVKGFEENYAPFAPNCRSLQEAREEKILFPEIATDRNVLNLPAIGKSMTFVTVGVTGDGRRVLKFAHDSSRRHSPIIDRMGEVYIVENKSIAAYLRQLAAMGEKVDDYSTIWQYDTGVTEPHSELYRYPDYPFAITDKMTNLALPKSQSTQSTK